MGAVFNTEEKFDDAIRTLQRGEALSPNSWQAYYELGKAFTAKGQYEPALRQLEKAQALAPRDYPPLHLIKARAMMGLNNYAEEMAELQKYLDKEPQGANSEQARKMLDQARAFTQSGQASSASK
jgi:tetratricopeptide (TPR) repeat protein